jgi:hypothetical protein
MRLVARFCFFLELSGRSHKRELVGLRLSAERPT